MSSPSSFGEGPVPSRETPEIEEFVGSFTQMCDKLSRRIRQLKDENDRLEIENQKLKLKLERTIRSVADDDEIDIN